jgi:SAM-dependent methyltransferase
MSNLVLVPCPLCNGSRGFYPVKNTDLDLHIEKYGDLYSGMTKSNWQACGTCGFLHQNPRPTVESLNQFYLDSKYHTDEIPEAWQTPENYLEFARWYYEEKIDYALKESGLKQGAVFDVGFGLGGVLRLFANRGWRAYGVESDQNSFDYAKKKLELASIQEGVLHAGIDVDTKVDLVFSNHTLEHVANLHDAMIGLTRVLKPGGYVFTAIPTYYKNRSNLSLQWLNSSHYSMFTHNSLNQLFAYHGLEEVTHTYRGWHKEIDDLWHLARFTGKVIDPKAFYESPAEVCRYVNTINPARSIIHYPIYSNYARSVQTYERIKSGIRAGQSPYYVRMLEYYARMLVNSPKLFVVKTAQRVRKKISEVL